METVSLEQYSKLLESSKDLEMFTLGGRILLAKVVDVYDGDTCKVNVFLFENVLKKFTVRMMGYDTPEMRTKNSLEKKYGLRSKTILSSLILNKIVKLECLEFDKYGRILGNIICKDSNNNDININNFMIENHLGYCYLGDTKKKFDELMTGGYYSDVEIKLPETKNYPI